MRSVALLVGLGAALGVASSAGVARADDGEGPPLLGRAGQLVLGIPRLLPVLAVNSRSVGSSAPSDAPTGTSVSFGNHPSGLTVYDLARLGLEAFATAHLTLGVDLAGYVTLGATPTPGSPYVSILGAVPHVGYVAPLSRTTSFWLRAGVAYYLFGEKGVDAGAGAGAAWSFTWKQLDADLEVHLVVAAFPHMAVTAGVVVEAPLTGSFSEQRGGAPNIDAGAAWTHVGFVGGLLTYL